MPWLDQANGVTLPCEATTSSGDRALLRGPRLGLVIAGLQLSLLLSALDQTIVTAAMPLIVTELAGFDLYAWPTTSYLLTSTIALLLFGRLADIKGRKTLLLSGLAIFVTASLLCGLSGLASLPGLLNGMNQLIAARALQGIGSGAVLALTFTIIADLFSPSERGRYQGLFAAVFALASVSGPSLGGFIADQLSWRWAFLVNIPVGLAAMAVIFLSLRQNNVPERRGAAIDPWATAFLIGCLAPLLVALSMLQHAQSLTVAAAVWLAAAGFAACLFFWRERRCESPFFSSHLWRSPVTVICCLSLFVTGIGMFGSLLLIPLLMQGGFSLTATQSGGLMTPLIVVVAAASVAGGYWISRLRRYKGVSVLALALMTTGTFLLSGVTPATHLAKIVISMLIVGTGLGLLLPIYTVAIQNDVPDTVMGSATGLSQFVRSLGGTVGVAVFGALMYSVYRRALYEHFGSGSVVDPLNLQLTGGSSAAHSSVAAIARAALIQAVDHVFLIYALMLLAALVCNAVMPDIELKTKGHNQTR